MSMSFIHVVPTPGQATRFSLMILDMMSFAWSLKNMVVPGPYISGLSKREGSLSDPGLIFMKTIVSRMKMQGKIIYKKRNEAKGV